LLDWLVTCWRRWWWTVTPWGWNTKHHLHLISIDFDTTNQRSDEVASAVPVDPVKTVAYSHRKILKARQDEYQLAFRVFCVPGCSAFCLELR
jgi:hypothetical protein